MAGNKSIIVFLLLLAFLLFITLPLVLILGYSFGLLQLPQIDYRGIATAATAGLFVIPVLMVFLAVIIVAVKKRATAIPSVAVARPAAWKEHVRYPWEGMFGGEEKEYAARRKTVSKPSAAGFKLGVAVAVVIAAVVLALFAVLQQKGADAFTTNKTLVEKPAVVEVKPQQNFTFVQLSAAVGKVIDSAKSFGSKVKGKFVSSSSKVWSAVAKAPVAVWQGSAVAAVLFLFTVAVFYSARSGQLAEIPEWFTGWLGWLLGIFEYARKNKLKVLLWVVAAAVASAGIAAVVLRKWIIVKFPSVSASGLRGVAVNALFSVRDFVSAYRLYILIGIFALLAVISILFIYEKREKKEKSM